VTPGTVPVTVTVNGGVPFALRPGGTWAVMATRGSRDVSTPVIVTGALVLLVSVKVVNGTRLARAGASELAGCVPAVTVMPGPVVVVPPPVVVVVVVPPVHIALAAARVPAYQLPVPDVRPCGVKIVAALAFWNLMTAAFVNAPKYDVSFPGEPAPVAAIVKPLLLRNFWTFSTCPPEAPTLRFCVNVKQAPVVVVVVDDEPAWSVAICASNAWICVWRSETVSAFAGAANANANPKTITTPKSTAATFFVANALLIVCF